MCLFFFFFFLFLSLFCLFGLFWLIDWLIDCSVDVEFFFLIKQFFSFPCLIFWMMMMILHWAYVIVNVYMFAMLDIIIICCYFVSIITLNLGYSSKISYCVCVWLTSEKSFKKIHFRFFFCWKISLNFCFFFKNQT